MLERWTPQASRRTRLAAAGESNAVVLAGERGTSAQGEDREQARCGTDLREQGRPEGKRSENCK